MSTSRTRKKRGGNNNNEFIFFGCWNQVNCGNTQPHNYRDTVLDYIIANEKDAHRLFLAGDNWYANLLKDIENGKPVSYNYYLTSVLKSGYDKILEMKKETDIVLGNHDIDNMTPIEDLQQHCMLKTQMHILSKYSQHDSTFDAPSLEDLQWIEAGKNKKVYDKIILHLDDVDMNETDTYIIIFINSNKLCNDESYLTSIQETLKSIQVQKPIFLLGHHPITAYTHKNDKDVDNVITNNHIYFDKICELFIQYKVIYLCADTHNFQIATLTNLKKDDKNFLQIVSGTGGGDPDNVPKNVALPTIRDVYGYRYNANIKASFGYTKIKINSPSHIVVSYSNVVNKDSLDNITYTYDVFFKDNKWTYSEPTIALNSKPLLISNVGICAPIAEYNKLSSQDDKNKHPLRKQIVLSNANKENKEKPIYCYRKEKKEKKPQ